jgi:UDP-2-acetamido-3-amino-2,3-dideoxy-glucuronate N-acetyltransferase
MTAPAGVFVHPLALCDSDMVGAGTRIWAFAHVMAGAVVGRDCNIGEHAFVETGAKLGDRVTLKNQALVWDGVEIGDDVFVGPGVCFTNDRWPRSPRLRLAAVAARYRERRNWLALTHIETGASLGARAVILPGVRVGAWAMVAAGAIVTHDVMAHALALGAPARRVGWVCRCGLRLAGDGQGWHCPECGLRFTEKTDGGCTSLAPSC